ncbi:MAG: hypothetical protein B6D65_02225 [candidate division Zixibacteria bacterium 4484_93]|nr:MAG: hypothetical protein B6D65_02225 [candidate division Zixibacteria bacterium 4484_93]RKZ33437.1 MAG: hypothetical protein DRQ19_02895 [bacterium]
MLSLRKTVPIILILGGVFLSPTIKPLASPQTLFLHNTGATSLRVDDYLPGGFVYHNLGTSSTDNLWRAFFALYFEEFPEDIAFGQANDEGELSSGTFSTMDSLDASEDSTSATSSFSFQDTTIGITIYQRVLSCKSNEHWIRLNILLSNNSDENLTGGKLLFFYDADIPAYDFDNDYCGLDSTRLLLYEYDSTFSIWTGFAILTDTLPVLFGNFNNWYAKGNSPEDILELITSPTWDSSISDTDCAVYSVIPLNDIPAGGETDTISFAFVCGEALETISSATDEARGDTSAVSRTSLSPKDISISIFPNPFNSSVRMRADSPGNFRIYDITGREVASFKGKSSAIWHADKSTSGVYIVEFVSGPIRIAKKAVLLK